MSEKHISTNLENAKIPESVTIEEAFALVVTLYKTLQKENSKLKEKLKKSQQRCKYTHFKCDTDLEKAEKVIEFYADKNNWGEVVTGKYPFNVEVQTIFHDTDFLVGHGECGGVKARNYFKEKEKR